MLVTYPEGPEELDRQARLLLSRPPHQRILLTVHNPNWLLWNAGAVTLPLLLSQVLPHAGEPWGEAGAAGAQAAQQQQEQRRPQPVQLLSLAPCGSTYSKSFLESWVADMKGWEPEVAHIQARLEVPWIAPLVPWEPSAKRPSAGGGLGKGSEGAHSLPLKHLCIQVGLLMHVCLWGVWCVCGVGPRWDRHGTTCVRRHKVAVGAMAAQGG